MIFRRVIKWFWSVVSKIDHYWENVCIDQMTTIATLDLKSIHETYKEIEK